MTTKLFFNIILYVVLSLPSLVAAQTTEFTYQGRLTDGTTAANSNYDFEFRLYGTASDGTLLGTQTESGVPVSNGVFTVRLDFGAQFTGEARWLEIAIKPAGSSGGYQQLLPRQPITSTPYAIRSLNAGTAETASNANQLGGVNAAQYVQTNDSRLSDARSPLAGSGNYVQNRTTPQSANFNIGGTGRANVLDATTRYEIGGNRVIGIDGSAVTAVHNLFVGINAGTNTTGNSNSFFGKDSGTANSSGSANSFFGYRSGLGNTTGAGNSFFGADAGTSNTTGGNNSFFGYAAGTKNTEGTSNSFFGYFSGFDNTTGVSNSFFGNRAGNSNTTGDLNTFVGRDAGRENKAGYQNTFLGAIAGSGSTIGHQNVFVGVATGRNNTLGFLNSIVGAYAGLANTTGEKNSFFGAGTGDANTTGVNNSFLGYNAGDTNTTGSNNTVVGTDADVGLNNLTYATAVGAGAIVSNSNSIVLGRADGSDAVRIPGSVIINGSLVVHTLGSAGTTQICLNSANRIAGCSSSLRYKTNIKPFNFGLNLVNRLKPITFDWKNRGMADLGLGAEDVAAIEPLLVTYNKDGKVEGVKYDRIGVVLLNAVKEQQAQIEQQNLQIETQEKRLQQQQMMIDSLKQIVCSQNPAEICKKTKGEKKDEK